MVVVAAPGIELCTASRAAGITLHVLKNGQNCAAGAAKYCRFIPCALRPERSRMIGERLVTIFAGIVKSATFHLDGDDVSRAAIVLAAGL